MKNSGGTGLKRVGKWRKRKRGKIEGVLVVQIIQNERKQVEPTENLLRE